MKGPTQAALVILIINVTKACAVLVWNYYLSPLELLRGIFLIVRGYVEAVVVLCVEGPESERFL